MQESHFPHRRFNPLENKWVLVSPQRMNRPWSGQIEKAYEETLPEFDPACYLCPGNARSGGQRNPAYRGVYSFANDFSALLPDTPEELAGNGFLRRQNDRGICEVICYSPAHNRPMAVMSRKEIARIVRLWQERYRELARRKFINHVQIFENRGNEVGNSNPHPHGQIWAQRHVPYLPALELKRQETYYEKQGKILLADYLGQELKNKARLVYHNGSFAVLVPFWAEWPYETMILPKTVLRAIDELDAEQVADLAKALSATTRAYAKLFSRPTLGAPYTMGIHQKPADGKRHPGALLHLHFQPPLLTAARQKFMVGYERFAQPQRDITAERAAAELREIANMLKIR